MTNAGGHDDRHDGSFPGRGSRHLGGASLRAERFSDSGPYSAAVFRAVTGCRRSAPVTRLTSVIESKGRLIASCALRTASLSAPDMKQNALPSFRLTWAACAPTPNRGAASSSASNCAQNSASVSSPWGKLPFVLSCVSMKYFTVDLPSTFFGHIVHMHDTNQAKVPNPGSSHLQSPR